MQLCRFDSNTSYLICEVFLHAFHKLWEIYCVGILTLYIIQERYPEFIENRFWFYCLSIRIYLEMCLSVLIGVLSIILLTYVFIASYKKRCFNSVGSTALFVIAHPDDECMFFAPTILNLLKEDYRICLICLSSGNPSLCSVYNILI